MISLAFYVLKFVSSIVFSFSFFKTIILEQFLATIELRGKYRDFSYSPCSHMYSAFSIINITLGVVHAACLDKCIMTYIHHYNITTLKILCAPPVHLPPSPTIDLFVSIVVPFPACHTVGIIQHMVFLDWFLSCSNMYLRFLHDFSWLASSFPFSTK